MPRRRPARPGAKSAKSMIGTRVTRNWVQNPDQCRQGCGGPTGVPAGTGTVGVMESGCTPGGSCEGDSKFGGIMTIGGGTTAGDGAGVCCGVIGSAGLIGDDGGSTEADGTGGAAGTPIGGAAVDGEGIGVCIGPAGAAERSWAYASGAPAQKARLQRASTRAVRGASGTIGPSRN